MIISSDPRKISPFWMRCACGAVIMLDATALDEAKREVALRHVCSLMKGASIEKATR